MTRSLSPLPVAAFLAVWFASLAVGSKSSATEQALPPRFALLVGVQHYPKLKDHEQLAGCANDVAAMRQTLINRFGFQNADIVCLVNEQATGDAIRREFAKLVERVQLLNPNAKAAQVVFHFSGHGSQIQDQPSGHPDCDEQDGLDETLVPFDAMKQGGPEDIRDDELYAFCEQLCGNGDANVWCILDCCHSGTGARGVTRFRSLVRGSVLPLEPTEEASRIIRPKQLPTGAVLLAACRAHEKAPEFEAGSLHYGLLTRFLTQVLNEEASLSQITYDNLSQSIAERYRVAGVMQPPTPQLEGGTGRVVLGAGSTSDLPPAWKVSISDSDRSQATMSAGLLHGVTIGSLFELYLSPDEISQADTPAGIAWLRIQSAQASTAGAQFFRWEGERQVPIKLSGAVQQGYAVQRKHEYGDFSLHVRVLKAIDEQTDGPPLAQVDSSLPAPISDLFSSDEAEGDDNANWLHLSAENERCDALIRLAGNFAAVFPATGRASFSGQQVALRNDVPAALRGGWGPIDLRSEQATGELARLLRQVYQVRNLQRIVASHSASTDSPQVEVELVAVKMNQSPDAPSSPRPWPVTLHENGQPSMVMHDGDRYEVRVTSREPTSGGRPLYATVLHLDANCGITILFPYQEDSSEEQLILPGETRSSGIWTCNKPGERAIHGPRVAIALATREPNDFYRLARSSLETVRGNTRGPQQVLDSLLVPQTPSRTRGATTAEPTAERAQQWSAHTIEWLVRPF